jgi:site-specific DNA-methyltransferase (adenine-specific)
MLINEDCLKFLPTLPDNSIDLIFTDLPYKETGNKWDNKLIDTKKLFYEYERLVKEDGCIALHCTMRFANELINNAKHLYKYEWVWEKDNGTNVPNVNQQPFRNHEFIVIFGKGRVTHGKRTAMKYFPQKTKGYPYKQKSGRVSENWKGGLSNIITDNSGDRHPLTVQKHNRDKGLHPTQKPVSLAELIVKSYTNEGDLVLDNCMGSGTIGVACKNVKRDYIGVEIDTKYFDIAKRRINDTVS